MKYIRTKDGICDLSTLYIQNCNLLKTGCKNLYDKLMSEKIKEANTIEELCDEFVLVGICGIPYGSKQVLNEEDKHEKDFLVKLVKSQDYEIYGSIWTDKGLIYVAKMNEKGELELL